MKRKNKKGKTKANIIKKILQFIFLTIVGLGVFVKYIFKTIDTEVPKIFMKAPRLFRQCVIYTMIVLSISCFLGRDYDTKEVVYNKPIEVSNSIEITEEMPLNDEIEVSEEVIEEKQELSCHLSGIECSIYYEALEQGLSENQAYMVMSISKQETGHWTSDAYKFSNNIGGIMNGNSLKSYNAVSDGISDMVSILKKYYFNEGLDTLEKIQKKYCPIGAKNDPQGLNNYWLKNTTIFLNEYLGGK